MQIFSDTASGLDITGFVRGRAHPYNKDLALGKDEVLGFDSLQQLHIKPCSRNGYRVFGHNGLYKLICKHPFLDNSIDMRQTVCHTETVTKKTLGGIQNEESHNNSRRDNANRRNDVDHYDSCKL